MIGIAARIAPYLSRIGSSARGLGGAARATGSAARYGSRIKGFASRAMENDPIYGGFFGMFRTAGTTAEAAAGGMERGIAQAVGSGSTRGPGFIARRLKGYKKWSPVITAGAITGGFAKGFTEETFGNQQAVDTLRFFGGGTAGGYNPVGEYGTQMPVTPLASNLGTTQYSEDQLGATGQLALDTFYARHGR